MSELPIGWVETTLSEIGKWGSGGTPKATNEKYYGGTIPWAKIGDLNDGRVLKTEDFITEEGLLNSSAKLVEVDTLLVAMYGSIGKLGIAGVRLATNQAIAFCKISEKLIIKELAFYYLRHRREHLLSIGQGGTQQNISQTILKAYPIPLPPLNEQRRIVAKLDRLFDRSRRAREELERIPKLCDRYKQAILAAAFRGDLTAGWGEFDSKIDPWKVISLGSVIQSIKYGTSKKCDYLPALTPVLRIPNIGDGYIVHSDIKYAEFEPKETEGLQLQPGDILIIRSNGSLDLVGKAAIVSKREEGFLYAGYLIRLRPNCEIILPEYLYYHLIEPGTRSEIELLAKSTSGVNNINSQELQSLSLRIPGLQEQKEIVNRVEKLFKAIDLIRQEYQKASKLLDRLEQATLSKAFRGELVPQDPNDEPASVLLERIHAERQN